MENGAKRKRKVGEGTSPMEVDSGVEGSSQVPKFKRHKVSDDEMRKVPVPLHAAQRKLAQNFHPHRGPSNQLQLEVSQRGDQDEQGDQGHCQLGEGGRLCQGLCSRLRGRRPLGHVRLDDLYLDSFDVKDVKTLKGNHLARCIGRLAGKVHQKLSSRYLKSCSGSCRV